MSRRARLPNPQDRFLQDLRADLLVELDRRPDVRVAEVSCSDGLVHVGLGQASADGSADIVHCAVVNLARLHSFRELGLDMPIELPLLVRFQAEDVLLSLNNIVPIANTRLQFGV